MCAGFNVKELLCSFTSLSLVYGLVAVTKLYEADICCLNLWY